MGDLAVKAYDAAAIRNLALVGHSASGKTSLGEALLYTAGAVNRLGKVQDGSSILAHTSDEVKRQISIYLSLAQFEHKEHKINLLDCPGYADFVGEVHAGLQAADAALIVVNQLDKEQGNFAKAVQSIRAITDRAVPFVIPVGEGPGFEGVMPVLEEKAVLGDSKSPKLADVPGDLAGAIEEAKLQLTELAAESDDALLEKYLESGELSHDEVEKGFRTGIAQGRIFPIFATSAEKNLGISVLIDGILDLAPSPLDVGGTPGLRPGATEEAPIKGDPSDPLAALVFKVTSEVLPQDLYLLRVYSGKIEKGMEAYNARRDQAERIGQIYFFRGKERIDTDRLVAGDIGATVNLKSTSMNDCFSTKDGKIVLAPMSFPNPVHEVAVAPAKKGDEEKIGSWLNRLAGEDPTLQVRVDSSLHQTLIRCMGDLHIDVLLDRMKRRGQVEAEVYKPRIPFRETIRGSSDVAYRHKKQTGGRGQFADVSIKVEPLPRGDGFEFVDEIVGGVIPSKFIPAVEKGVVEKMTEGVVAGYPVVDVRVRLHFGSYHDVDSSEMAFKIAAKMAFKDGIEKAQPVLLEPISKVEVNVPDDYMGDVMGDLSSRRGKILGMESAVRGKRVVAMVPQAEIYQYSTKLRSMTQGRGRFSFEFDHYEEVPRDIQEKLVEQLRREQEEANA
ncbi:MAG: elongation factor G [Candidatus Eisenbacteria bacterium]|nr:elongation factor G [Candidatus Latescibacterota bacterium]MBD3301690.1 elongation factor G [Candidatus Eisenbacteria bacterium]